MVPIKTYRKRVTSHYYTNSDGGIGQVVTWFMSGNISFMTYIQMS